MRLIILGAGGYGRTVADVAAQTDQFDMIYFLDDQSAAKDVFGKCAGFERFRDEQTAFYPAFGNNETRLDWLKRLKAANCAVATIIHTSAYVSPTAQIEPGTAILPHAIVNTNCVIKGGCIINCGAIVDHGCVLEDSVHVCLGAIVKAENHIPQCMKIEAGEVVQNRTYPL
jgi:sugar O-acyltransferase (sialic acid O-acetyltransferase NeuD family)